MLHIQFYKALVLLVSSYVFLQALTPDISSYLDILLAYLIMEKSDKNTCCG